MVCLGQRGHKIHSEQLTAGFVWVKDRDRTSIDRQSLKVVQWQAEKISHRQLDRVGVKNHGDHFIFFMGANYCFEGGYNPNLHLDEGFSARELKLRWFLLNDFPEFISAQHLPVTSGPFTHITIGQFRPDLDFHSQGFRQRLGGLDRPLQRTAINGFDWKLAQALVQ